MKHKYRKLSSNHDVTNLEEIDDDLVNALPDLVHSLFVLNFVGKTK